MTPQIPDTQPGPYYVTVIDGQRVGFLAGPFQTHAEALAMVDATRNVACEVDSAAAFYAFGTARRKDGLAKPGVLNGRLGLVTA